MPIPRKLKEIKGWVFMEYGVVPYEADEEKQELLTLKEIVDKGFRERHLIYVQGHAGLMFGEGVTQLERTAAEIVNKHVMKNLDLIVAKKYYYDLFKLMKARKVSVVEDKDLR